MKSFNKLSLAVALTTAGMGLSSVALADIYALSVQEVKNFGIAGNYTVTGGTVTSSSKASLTGFADESDTKFSSLAGPPPNADTSCVGPGCTYSDDSYDPIGKGGSQYSLGDAIVDNLGLGATPPTGAARNIAEGYLPTGNVEADSQGRNTLAANFRITSGGGALTFSFDQAYTVIAQALLEAGVPPQPGIPDSFAQASLNFVISITGVTNPSFAEDITFSNISLTADDPNEDLLRTTRNDTNYFDVFDNDDFQSRSAVSSALVADNEYTVTVNMVENTELLREEVPVPEPGTLLLLGAGLVGLGYRRLRQQS